MKKLFLIAVVLVGFGFSAKAQQNAIGLRLGDNDGFGAEVSYQRSFSSSNRLELDLGWRDSDYYDAVKLTALYQWVWNIEGGFNWYAGAGGGLGSWEFDDKRVPDFADDDDSGTFLFIAGDIGVEYNFDIPLQLALDFRPEIYFGDDFREDDFGPDIALAIRYRF